MRIVVRSSGAKVLTGGGSVVAVQKQELTSDSDGDFTFEIDVGSYYVRFGHEGPEIRILIVDDVATYEFEEVVDDEIASLGITPNLLAVLGYSLAEMRALTKHVNHQMAEMLWFTTNGDGGAGKFYYDSSSSATDDNGLSTVKPTNIETGNPGRWIRLL